MAPATTEGRRHPAEAEVLICLSNRIPRRTVATLEGDGGGLAVTGVTARLDAGGSNAPVAGDRHQLETMVREEHLPRLEAAGAVEFDPSADAVRKRGNFGVVCGYLESATAADQPWVESAPSADAPEPR